MLRILRWVGLVWALASVAACGGGADTGFLRLQQGGVRVGYSSWDLPAAERWCLFPLPPGYKSPSATNPAQQVQYLYLGPQWLPTLPGGEPAWPAGSRRLAGAVAEMAPAGSTRPSGAEPLPAKPQPVGVGRYRLRQIPPGMGGLEEVGALIVEPYQGETRQHWFLFGGPTNPPGPKAPYTEPSPTTSNVTTTFEYVSGDVYSVDLAAFQTSLGFTPVTYRRIVLTEDNF